MTKQELESTIKDLQGNLEDEGDLSRKMAIESNVMREKISEIEGTLEEEEAQLQKLHLDKLNLENQINRISEENTAQDETVTKVEFTSNM